MNTTTTATRATERPGDDQVVAGRLAWLAGARTEQEAHLVEAALLARTDNGPHDGDPDADPGLGQGAGR